MLQENKYFILDEPFNGVDFQSNIIITEIIHKLKELGKTIIISSHIFSTLNDTCDEIMILENNSISKECLNQILPTRKRNEKKIQLVIKLTF